MYWSPSVEPGSERASPRGTPTCCKCIGSPRGRWGRSWLRATNLQGVVSAAHAAPADGLLCEIVLVELLAIGRLEDEVRVVFRFQHVRDLLRSMH